MTDSSLDNGPEISYFGLQAYLDATKHMGGLDTTKELVELCHIDKDKYVLEVGCGVGATACYLAKEIGCRVLGVDVRESMISRARERAEREHVADLVEFQVEDAQALSFNADTFDVVICESVLTFVENKQQAVSEYARVAKPCGYVGLNEEVWLKQPTEQLTEAVEYVWEIDAEIPTSEDWVAWMKGVGMEDVVARVYEFDARRESTQVTRYGCSGTWKMLSRTMALYVRNRGFREYMKGRRSLPRGIFEYLGYVVLAGRV